MASLIDRYIYDVTRRLPEKDREDVKRELAANIYDMLPDYPTEEQVKALLAELGSPAVLAAKYRQSPQYLIGPEYYNEYIRVLKWVVPLISIILLIVGVIFGALDALKEGPIDYADFFIGMFVKGISFAFAGALNALFWITIGFAIAQRTGAKNWAEIGKWTVDDLEDVIPEDKDRIPLSDSIVELIVIVSFAGLFIAWLMDMLPFGFAVIDGDTQIRQLFSTGFIAICIPVVVVSCLVSVGECVAKIADRRWTPRVCVAVAASSLIGIGLMVYLFSAPEIFNPEFTDYFLRQDWAQSFEKFWFIGGSFEKTVVFIIAAIVIIASLAECGSAIYKTIRARRLSG